MLEIQMAETVIAGILWKASGWIAGEVAKCATQSLSADSPISNAIRLTGDAFPAVEGVEKSLQTWCESESFRTLFGSMKEGAGTLTDDNLLENFLTVSHFFSGADTKSLATQILQLFAQNLQDALYRSDIGISLLARRQEKLQADTTAAVRSGFAEVKSEMGALRDIVPILASDDIGVIPKVRDRVFHAKVDQARDLILDGKPRTAESMLEKLREELGSSGSPDLLFRITTNLGSCALQQGDEKRAADQFRAAITYQPESPKAIGNVALAELLTGDPEDALELCERARAIDPRDSHANIVMIVALEKLSRGDELNSLLEREKWIEEDSAGAWAIADLRLKEGNYSECERLLRKSLKIGYKHPNQLVALSKVIIDPIREQLVQDPPLPWKISGQVVKKIEEAEALLNRAVEALEKHDTRTHLHDALSNRAATRTMLGKIDDALRDCDRVLSENKDHLPALQNKALILMEMGRFAEAAKSLESVVEKGKDDHLRILIARALSAEGSHRKVIDLLHPEWHPRAEDNRQLEISELLLRGYIALGDAANAASVHQSIAETWPDNPNASRIRARFLWNGKKEQDAIALLEAAMSAATPNCRDRIALELADFHFAKEDFAKAASVLEEVVDKSVDNTVTRRYLVCLYNSNRLREAHVLARAIRSTKRPIPVISEIEALVLEAIGDLESASHLWIQLSEDYPDSVTYRLPLARIEFRRGERESARQRVLSVQYGEIKDNPEALIEIAEMRAILGISGVLPFIYRARQIDLGNPGTHLAYVSLFLSREHFNELPGAPEVVEAESAVHLRRNGEIRTFTITAEDSPDPSRGELPPSDALASKLLGRRKGDRVVLKESPFEDLSYEIVEVQSKYVFAFQQTLNEFSTRFPEHPGFYRIEFKENDFSKILVAVDQRHAFIAQLTRVYQEKGLPLSTVAEVAGVPVSEIWAEMVGVRGGRVLAAPGTQAARSAEAEMLARTSAMVLDITALLTLAYLELLDRLPKQFEKVLVAQAVLDEINQTLLKNTLGGRPSATLTKQGEFYACQEISPEVLDNRRKFLEKIRDFIESSTEVVPAITVLDLEQARAASLKRILPQCALASILVAEENGALLYSDDFGLRKLAKTEWKVEGVWTQTVLEGLCRSSALPMEGYQKALTNLILANYFFVSITPETILGALRENGMDISPEVQRLFAELNGPDCDENSAVQLASDLIRQVWLEPIIDHQRHMILDLTLSAISNGRLSLRAILKLKRALAVKFHLLPIQLKDVLQTIGLWEKQNSMRGGVIR